MEFLTFGPVPCINGSRAVGVKPGIGAVGDAWIFLNDPFLPVPEGKGEQCIIQTVAGHGYPGITGNHPSGVNDRFGAHVNDLLYLADRVFAHGAGESGMIVIGYTAGRTRPVRQEFIAFNPSRKMKDYAIGRDKPVERQSDQNVISPCSPARYAAVAIQSSPKTFGRFAHPKEGMPCQF